MGLSEQIEGASGVELLRFLWSIGGRGAEGDSKRAVRFTSLFSTAYEMLKSLHRVIEECFPLVVRSAVSQQLLRI